MYKPSEKQTRGAERRTAARCSLNCTIVLLPPVPMKVLACIQGAGWGVSSLPAQRKRLRRSSRRGLLVVLPVSRDRGQLQTLAPTPGDSPAGSGYWSHMWSSNSFPLLTVPLVSSGAHVHEDLLYAGRLGWQGKQRNGEKPCLGPLGTYKADSVWKGHVKEASPKTWEYLKLLKVPRDNWSLSVFS